MNKEDVDEGRRRSTIVRETIELIDNDIAVLRETMQIIKSTLVNNFNIKKPSNDDNDDDIDSERILLANNIWKAKSYTITILERLYNLSDKVNMAYESAATLNRRHVNVQLPIIVEEQHVVAS